MSDLRRLFARIRKLAPPRQKQVANYVEYLVTGLSLEEREEARKQERVSRPEAGAR